MTKSDFEKRIDWELERRVMLVVANEGAEGLYELPGELTRFNFKLHERMFVCVEIVSELLSERLIKLEEFQDVSDTEPSKTVPPVMYDKILNNHWSWYPSSRPGYSIGITALGIDVLENLGKDDQLALKKRMFSQD